MGNNFQWHTDTEIDPPPGSFKPQRSWDLLMFWLATAVIIIFLTGSWFLTQRRLAQVDDTIKSDVQALLDLQHQAFLAGDGDLFFSTFSPDATLQAAQLLPFNQAPQHQGLTLTRIETNQEIVWGNATWLEGTKPIQRLLFFENRNGRYHQIASDPEYWGQLKYSKTAWGEIYHYEVDEEWLPRISSFVAEICEGRCEPVTLMLTDNFMETAVPHQIVMPSPRLIGLNEMGTPSSLFWQQLRRRLEDHLKPTTIRFAIPPPRTIPCCRNLDYEKAAAEFMRQYPKINVVLVPLETNPEALDIQITNIDGAAIPPTIDMVAAGNVFDLTDFANSDAGFHASDFYEHIWQGSIWRDRFWFMPLTAEFQLVYYDKTAFKTANVPEPNLFWQWDTLRKNASDIAAAQLENSYLRWQFLDISRDALFSYAYSLADNCPETAVPPCQTPLQANHIVDTLTWYKKSIHQEQIPDLSQQTDAERAYFMNNFQSARRHALFWVDNPISYESYQLLDPVGIVPFPGIENMVGVTPLWVDGAFITAHSQHPYATWQWLTFLSYQSPNHSYRLVAARSSVAAKTRYWQTLPRPLVDPMRTAYTFSRPVTLPEKRYFDWMQLKQLVSIEALQNESSPQLPTINWFGQKER